MKIHQRMSFKKSNKNSFLDRFKTEVRESSSIDAMRISQINQSHFKIINLHSPQYKKSITSTLPISSPYKDTKMNTDNDRNQNTVKMNLKVMSPKYNQQQTVKSIRQSANYQLERMDQDQEKFQKRMLRLSRSFKEEEQQMSPDKRSQSDRSMARELTQEMLFATKILFENSQKLKKYPMFQKQTQHLQNVLKNLATKLQSYKIQQKQRQHDLDEQFQDRAIEEVKMNLVKKQLFLTQNSISEHDIDEEQDSSMGGQSDMRERQNNNKIKVSSIVAKSKSSFKVQNQELHWNQHLNIYQASKNTIKSSSNRDFTVKSSNLMPEQTSIPSHNRCTSDIQHLKAKQKDINFKDKNRPSYCSRQPQMLPQIVKTSQFAQSIPQTQKGQSQSSSTEHERKRTVLNEIISLLNRKYNKNINFS